MTNHNITISEAQEIIDKLIFKENCYIEIEGQEVILIGDVLEKIYSKHKEDAGFKAVSLIILWRHCGFIKSLQQILDEAETEKGRYCSVCDDFYKMGVLHGGNKTHDEAEEECEIIKTPEVAQLFIFLKNVL